MRLAGCDPQGVHPKIRARLRASGQQRLEAEQARAYGVPRSILLGRPVPQSGEPLFTEEDTAYALALAEEERETCVHCGLPIVVCSDPQYQYAFEGRERMCWPTYALAQHRNKDQWKAKLDDTKAATFPSAKWREGKAAPLDAGLGLDGAS